MNLTLEIEPVPHISTNTGERPFTILIKGRGTYDECKWVKSLLFPRTRKDTKNEGQHHKASRLTV